MMNRLSCGLVKYDDTRLCAHIYSIAVPRCYHAPRRWCGSFIKSPDIQWDQLKIFIVMINTITPCTDQYSSLPGTYKRHHSTIPRFTNNPVDVPYIGKKLC